MHTTAPHNGGYNANTPEARHSLNRMAEALAELTKKTYEQQNKREEHHHEEHSVEKSSVPEHTEQLFLPKHEEHLLIPDQHTEKHSTHHSVLPPMPRADLIARATNAFYAENGAAYWTLGELGDALVSLSDDAFFHHVTAERNDFVSWIEGCFTGTEQLFARKLRHQTREGMIKAFIEEKRVLEEKRVVEEKRPLMQPIVEPVRMSDEVVHHDEKRPVASTWSPVMVEGAASVASVLEALSAARLMARTDITAAREKFIATRTIVFSTLRDEERAQVLPKLREAYEHLRRAR